MNIRTLFISDVHLGSRYSSSAELLDFLERVKTDGRPQKIYIVGDFIDGWKLKRNWYWDDNASLVIRKILSFLRRNTEIYWVAGNHDDFLRHFIDDYSNLSFGHIHVGNQFIHEMVNGRKLLVVHGDMFDMVSQYAKWLCWLGDMGYEILLHVSRIMNKVRKAFGMRHWSLSKAIKHNVKKAVNYVADFEKCLAAYTREKGCEGVVCGHIHSAALRNFDDGFLYANSGDWVESCTAIYEDFQGELHLYNHHPA